MNLLKYFLAITFYYCGYCAEAQERFSLRLFSEGIEARYRQQVKENLENFYNCEVHFSQDSLKFKPIRDGDVVLAKPFLDSLVKLDSAKVRSLILTKKPVSVTRLSSGYNDRFGLIRGLASSVGGDWAIVSTDKLRRESGTEDVFAQLFVKTCRHEVGHLLGLHHCGSDKCLMKSGIDPQVFQVLDYYLCERCENQIKGLVFSN